MNRIVVLSLALVAGLAAVAAKAEDAPVRIGVLNDQSGAYADFQGIGSVVAAQMAADDYGGKVAGRKIEVLSGDHQNKTDLGASIARRWFDTEGVDLIADVPNSSIALVVADLAREKNKVFIGSGAGTAALTGEKCSPNTVHWTYDTWSFGHALARALVKQQGAKTWFFITADYAFGHDLEKQASEEVIQDGGKVVGSVRHPIGAPDFSSFLVQAQASGAQIIALADAGADETNAIKQAAEFNLSPKQTLVGLIFGINNVPALGLKASQGLLNINPFYWDENDGTRAWARRFAERHPQHNYPNDMQAGVYASVLHYLKAVDKVGGSSDGRAVVAAMKAMPTDDPLFGKGIIREDGRKIHPMYLLQVKTPEESKGKWDVFKIISSIPGDEAFRPLSEGHCPLVGH